MGAARPKTPGSGIAFRTLAASGPDGGLYPGTPWRAPLLEPLPNVNRALRSPNTSVDY